MQQSVRRGHGAIFAIADAHLGTHQEAPAIKGGNWRAPRECPSIPVAEVCTLLCVRGRGLAALAGRQCASAGIKTKRPRTNQATSPPTHAVIKPPRA